MVMDNGTGASRSARMLQVKQVYSWVDFLRRTDSPEACDHFEESSFWRLVATSGTM